MSAPYTQQQQLAAVLTAASMATAPEVPERFSPPAQYVIAGEPWLEPGQTVGSWLVHLTVVLVVGRGSNEAQMNDLGSRVRSVLKALRGTRFAALSVDQPAAMAATSGASLGAAINVVTSLSRAEFEEE